MASLTFKPAQLKPAQSPRIIVVGNEKGGAGKSTIAIHMATALMHAGAKVAVIDLDLRQLSAGALLLQPADSLVRLGGRHPAHADAVAGGGGGRPPEDAGAGRRGAVRGGGPRPCRAAPTS